MHPTSWGRGVGTALMREALDLLRSDGFAEVSLWVIEGNRGKSAGDRVLRAVWVRQDRSVRHGDMSETSTRIIRLRLRAGASIL